MKFAPMAIPAMALLQQHDARRDILIEPAAWLHAAIEARGHSELGAQSGVKTNRLVCLSVCWPDCKPDGQLFSAEFVCLSVCLCL